MVEEEQSLPRRKGESSLLPSSDWSSLDDDSERNLEEDEDVVTETPEVSPRLEWWEEVDRKANEEEDEMLKEQEAPLDFFATAHNENFFGTSHNEKRTQAATAQAVPIESSPREPSRILACPQFPVGRFAEIARIWEALVERRKAFEGEASCSMNGEGATAAIVVISWDDEE
jgi:hypothetical protein